MATAVSASRSGSPYSGDVHQTGQLLPRARGDGEEEDVEKEIENDEVGRSSGVVDGMRHVTDSSGTRWEVAFFGGVATDTIVFTAPDGQEVNRTTIAGMFAGMTNAELVRLLEETPEDQGS